MGALDKSCILSTKTLRYPFPFKSLQIVITELNYFSNIHYKDETVIENDGFYNMDLIIYIMIYLFNFQSVLKWVSITSQTFIITVSKYTK